MRVEGDRVWLKFGKGKCDKEIASASNGLKFEYSGVFIEEFAFEIGSHPNEVFGFLPLPLILFVVVFTFAKHDSFGEVEIFSVHFKLNRWVSLPCGYRCKCCQFSEGSYPGRQP